MFDLHLSFLEYTLFSVVSTVDFHSLIWYVQELAIPNYRKFWMIGLYLERSPKVCHFSASIATDVNVIRESCTHIYYN